ncbi:MAG: CinA family nicotinamide mononucleotide deamidase-related protein, partial [Lachnospiraceae bacterium]|nr:CinA family nicotinamide mononucleotide deamidase-related protein [Lachnospiraceae bacterium]
IAEYFKVRGKEPTENNWKQALVPEGGRAIRNHNGTAPGILIEKDGKRIVLMPGPPNELESMFMEEIVPYLCTLGGNVIASVTVKLTGIGESSAETKVADLMEKQDNPTLAPYAKTGEVHFRVTARAETEAEAAALNEPLVAELKRRFGSAVYTTDEKVTLERAVVDMLLARGLTMTVAESCTGGMLAARLVNVSGVSEVFKAGFVTYANEAKSNLIHVKEATLAQFGAVSRETAQEMAQGAAKAAAADVAVAITGIAGPDGGTEEKPVGLVYITCYVCGKTDTQEHHFIGSRMTIRERVTAAALTQLRRCLLTL